MSVTPNPIPTNAIWVVIDELVSPTPDSEGYIPSESGQYTATLRLPDGTLSSVPIGRPVDEMWDSPIKVRPLRRGRVVFGLERGGEYAWFYTEKPKRNPCTGGGG
jgi:hypothetical protein